MYLPPGRLWKSRQESMESARTWAQMFSTGGTATEADPPKEYAPDLYNLAWLFWEVITFLANMDDLRDEDRKELSDLIREAEEAFTARFPALFPKDKVRDGFDALHYLVAAQVAPECGPSRLHGMTRRKAWASATWLRNALHNEYIAAMN